MQLRLACCPDLGLLVGAQECALHLTWLSSPFSLSHRLASEVRSSCLSFLTAGMRSEGLLGTHLSLLSQA